MHPERTPEKKVWGAKMGIDVEAFPIDDYPTCVGITRVERAIRTNDQLLDTQVQQDAP